MSNSIELKKSEEAARQSAARRREAAKRELARRLKQRDKEQRLLREQARHAKRVMDGQAIPIRFRHVINYGVGAARNTTTHPKVHQIKVVDGRFQTSTNHSTTQIKSSLKLTPKERFNNRLKQFKKAQGLDLTPKERFNNRLKQFKKAQGLDLTPKERFNNRLKQFKKNNAIADNNKPKVDKMPSGGKAEEAAAKKAEIQKANSTKEVRNTRKKTANESTRITAPSSARVKSSVGKLKQKASASKVKDKKIKSSAQKDNQPNKKTPEKVTSLNAIMSEKQTEPKIGGATTAISHSFQAPTIIDAIDKNPPIGEAKVFENCLSPEQSEGLKNALHERNSLNRLKANKQKVLEEIAANGAILGALSGALLLYYSYGVGLLCSILGYCIGSIVGKFRNKYLDYAADQYYTNEDALDVTCPTEIEALKVGIKAKNWTGYFSSYTNYAASRHPLSFAAGMKIALDEDEKALPKLIML